MKKQIPSIVIAALLCVLIVMQWGRPVESKIQETAYERVMNSRILRCGYVPYPPEMSVDPVTGALSGYLFEIMEKIADEAGLAIEWEEVSITGAFDGLYAGRYDAVCAGYFENPQRASRVIFSEPLNYTASFVYVRADDMRFGTDFSVINDPSVTVAVVDGEISAFIAEEKFSKAEVFALPQLASNPTEALTALASGKADVAFSQRATADAFMQNNPGQVKLVSVKPVQAYSQSLASFHPRDTALKAFFDTSIRALYANDFIPQTIQKYDPTLSTYLLRATPYRVE